METARDPPLDAPPGQSPALAWTCPRCGYPSLFRSRLRSRREAVLAAATPLRPYCCHECMYRGWRAKPPAAKVAGRAAPLRLLGAARDTTSRGVAAVRDSIARTADRLRRPARAASRVAALAVAVLVTVGLLVAGGRWLKGRLERDRTAANPTAAAVPALPAATPQLRAPAHPAKSVAAVKRPGSRARGTAASSRASAGAASSGVASSPRSGDRVAKADARSAEGAFAWGDARWGMTLRDATEALPARALSVRQGRAGAHSVARTATRLGSRPYLADLRFDRVAGLDEVQLTPSAELEDVGAAFEDAVAALTARYGAPTQRAEETSAAGSASYTAAWAAPGTQVSLRAWKTAIREAKVLLFDVKSGAVTPAPTGLEVTFAPAASR